jgi:DNA gyrase inhibitor GyrI
MHIRKFLFALLLIFSKFTMAIEEPSYQVSQQEAPFEIRQYAPMIIAEVEVNGDRDEASNKGFRIIADFIFGNNLGSDQESKKIAMTAPVTIEPQKIAMTAPVTIEQSEATKWRVRFVMPKEYSLQTLPKPNNKEISIRELPGKLYAVNQFNGLNGSEKIEKKTKELREWLEAKHFKVVGTPQLARYNPPWTLPPWRRNEILIEITP